MIGKNCFIGCNSIILKGTVLGDGCVVGAGAVVCGKFEDNCVIAGNPAKVIRGLWCDIGRLQNNQLHHLYSGIIHLMSCGYSQPYLLCWAI